MKCEPTIKAATYYSDILPSGAGPVTQRWTFMLILIIIKPADDQNSRSNRAEGRWTWLMKSRGKHALQIRTSLNINCTNWTPQTHIISISLTPSPFFRTLKSHNHFPFSSNSELPEGKKKVHDSFWFLSFLWRENKGVLWITASLQGKLVRWNCCGMTWSGVVHTTGAPFIHENTNLKADAVVLRADTRQRQPR